MSFFSEWTAVIRGTQLQRPSETASEYDQLRSAVIAYLHEMDNPVPDAGMRKNRREQMRELVRK